jgi:hypothetical protein
MQRRQHRRFRRYRPPRHPRRWLCPRRKQKPGRKVRAAVAFVPQPGSITERVYQALQKKSMSSLELQAALKLPGAQLYAPCHQLKEKGLIDSRSDDDTDGVRRYFAK